MERNEWRDKRLQGIVEAANKNPTGLEMYSSDRKSVQVCSEIDRTDSFSNVTVVALSDCGRLDLQDLSTRSLCRTSFARKLYSKVRVSIVIRIT